MKIKNRKPIGNMRFQRWVCLRSEVDWVTNPLFYGIFIALIGNYNHNSIVDTRSIPEVSK